MDSITVFPARRVITMDPGRPVAEALAVMDGKVLGTGNLTSMQPWLRRHSYVIDDTLKTKVILPGFIDPHTHFAMSSGFLAMLYVGPIESPGPGGKNLTAPTHEAVLAKLRDADRLEEDPTKPLVAWGLDPAVQGGHLHRDELDTITRAPHLGDRLRTALPLSQRLRPRAQWRSCRHGGAWRPTL